MKKIKRILLCLGLVLSLAACGKENGQGDAGQSSQTQSGGSTATVNPVEPSGSQPETSSETSEGTLQEESAGGKTLVVYYSATNNTEAVAGYIASATDADLFELIPTQSYSSSDLDWTDRDSRVSREHDDPSLRVVELESTVPENWDDYDIVFVGYPIWWGIAAWPVDGFISANDFTGKTVIPFCTSSSSGIGESGELLKEAAGTGDWLEGERFRSRVSEEDVRKWVEGLGLLTGH